MAQSNTPGIQPPASSAASVSSAGQTLGSGFNPAVPPPGFMHPPPGFDPSKPPPFVGTSKPDEPSGGISGGIQSQGFQGIGSTRDKTIADVVDSWNNKVKGNQSSDNNDTDMLGGAMGGMPPSLLTLNMSAGGSNLAGASLRALGGASNLPSDINPLDNINSRMDRDSRPGREGLNPQNAGSDLSNPMGDKDERILNGPRPPLGMVGPGLSGIGGPMSRGAGPMAMMAGANVPRGPAGKQY